jgi:glycosyltransferase involved in cell wall biosynthesis
MPSEPTISVLMPAYNAGRYVAAAVESILTQTYTDFEFLIIDDGSTDRTPRVLKRYAARDPRIRLVSRPNRGLVPTLNEGLALARGEFIARMDADDIALPHRFERQIAYMREHPDIICVGSAVMTMDQAGRDLIESGYPPDHETIQELSLRGRPNLWHPTAMMRREAVMAIGGYREEMKAGEDHDLWLRLGERGRLANLDEVLLRYRIHPGSKGQSENELSNHYSKMASDEACDRRGIARRYQPSAPYCEWNDRGSKHQTAVKYGWWGFMRGDRPMALHYAIQAIRWMPLQSGGWRLLACTILKPIRKGT